MRSRRSAIRRMAVLFVLIELIVLSAASFLIYRYAERQEAQERASRQEAVFQGAEQIYSVLTAATQMLQNLESDSRLSQLAYHSYLNEYDRSRIILGLLDNLNNIVDLYPVVEMVRVCFPGDQMELSSKDGYERSAAYSPPSADETKLTEFLYYENGALKMRIMYPLITSVTGTEPDYLCEITFSEHFLDSLQFSFGDQTRSGAVVLLTSQEGTSVLMEEPSIPEVSAGILADKVRVTDGKDRYDILYQKVSHYPLTLAAWQPGDSISKTMTAMIISIGTIIALTGLLLVFVFWRADRSIARPIRQLMTAFDEVRQGDLSTRIRHEKADEFSYIYESFNSMTERTQHLVEDIREQHTLLENAELAQLQAQIDPHFLYNSFNIIKYMADGEEYEQITEFVSSLAEYYRFINKEVRQSIPLAAEVHHMETYVFIQQMRFESRIQADCGSLPETVAGFLVPKLILQPLVENCYKHGLHNKLEEGRIAVRYDLDGSQLIITVEDNGGEMTPEKLEAIRAHIYDTGSESISHALANTRRRLELAYGDPDLLTVEINEAQGLRVKLTFDTTRQIADL